MNKQRAIRSIVLAAIVAVSLSACAGLARTAPKLTPVTVQLKWVHDAQFGGFYAADEQGYYAAEGIKATFLPGGPDVNVWGAVEDGTAQIGIAAASDLILARADGKPFRATATIFRRNPTVFFALASSGITRPQDFVGQTIRAVSDQPVVLHAITARVGISPDQYTEVALPSDLEMFASGEVPVWGAYLTALALNAQRAGHEINIIYPDDYGIHFYGDTLFATDNFIADNPDLTLRFLRATLKGWTYAVESPVEVGSMVAKYNAEADPELETAKMSASLPLVNTGEDHIGWMKPEMWAGMEETLREQNVLTGPVDISQVYTMQFLTEIYK